jgi:hypothetical protein
MNGLPPTPIATSCNLAFFWLGLKDWARESRKDAHTIQGEPMAKTMTNRVPALIITVCLIFFSFKWLVAPVVALFHLLGTSTLALLCNVLAMAGLVGMVIGVPLRIVFCMHQFCKQMCVRGQLIALNQGSHF